jgi:hypothetical protein
MLLERGEKTCLRRALNNRKELRARFKARFGLNIGNRREQSQNV